jgi:hypothetical protein
VTAMARRRAEAAAAVVERARPGRLFPRAQCAARPTPAPPPAGPARVGHPRAACSECA